MQFSTLLKSLVLVLISSLSGYQASAQCKANFSSGPSAPPSSCSMSFTDASTGTGLDTQYSWNFGDGQTSSAQNPAHTYTTAGTYTVCLTITTVISTGNSCTDTHCTPVHCVNLNGISDILNDKTISIYPNPSKGEFQVVNKQSILNNLEITIYNALGENIYSSVIDNKQSSRIDVISQPAGCLLYTSPSPRD